MKLQTSSEVRKLTSLRLPRAVLAGGVLFSGLLGAVGAHLTKHGHQLVLSDPARAVTPVMWFLVLVVAVISGAGEFQHRTMRTTLLAAPNRVAVLAAKGIVASAYGVLLTLGGVAAAVATGVGVSVAEGTQVRAGTATAWLGLLAAIGIGGLWAILASALGMLTRSTALALTTLLLWRFVGEGILPVILRRPGISSWTPTGVANALADPSHPAMVLVLSALAVVGYIAAVTAAAALSFTLRDPV